MPLVTAFNLRTEDRLDHIEAAVREALVNLPEQQINVHEVDFVQVLKPDGFHGSITRINIDLWERRERRRIFRSSRRKSPKRFSGPPGQTER